MWRHLKSDFVCIKWEVQMLSSFLSNTYQVYGHLSLFFFWHVAISRSMSRKIQLLCKKPIGYVNLIWIFLKLIKLFETF